MKGRTDLAIMLKGSNHHLHVAPATSPAGITPCRVEVSAIPCKIILTLYQMLLDTQPASSM